MMKKSVFCFLLIILMFSSCSGKQESPVSTDIQSVFRNSYTNIEENRISLNRQSLDAFYETLSDEQKIGQLFVVSLDGNTSDRVPAIYSANTFVPGGYLLFGFNIAETADETIEFLAALSNIFIENDAIPPYVSIDHEGGVVNRLKAICSKLPSQLSVAKKFTSTEATRLYELHGLQLKNLGININLAPVVEVLTEENVLFLDNRSYGGIDDVIAYSKAQLSGMSSAGVLPVLKHFPGNTNNDPHTGLPILNCDRTTLENIFIKPFTQILDEKTMAGVLVAHTVVPAVDDKPACLSSSVISLLDTGAHPFNGLVFSDDLLMKALIKNGYPVEKSLIGAINAGVNILMISTGMFDEYAAIIYDEYKRDAAFRAKVDASVKKILEWKISCNLLERTVTNTGFFEYEAAIALPAVIDEQQVASRKAAFMDAFTKAGELYDEIWWSR